MNPNTITDNSVASKKNFRMSHITYTCNHIIKCNNYFHHYWIQYNDQEVQNDISRLYKGQKSTKHADTITTTILRPLYRKTYNSRHPVKQGRRVIFCGTLTPTQALSYGGLQHRLRDQISDSNARTSGVIYSLCISGWTERNLNS